MSNTFGLKPESLADIIHAHKIARRGHNEQQMKHIEDSLAGIGCHTIRDMLHDGEYIKAAELHRAAGEKE